MWGWGIIIRVTSSKRKQGNLAEGNQEVYPENEKQNTQKSSLLGKIEKSMFIPRKASEDYLRCRPQRAKEIMDCFSEPLLSLLEHTW